MGFPSTLKFWKSFRSSCVSSSLIHKISLWINLALILLTENFHHIFNISACNSCVHIFCFFLIDFLSICPESKLYWLIVVCCSLFWFLVIAMVSNLIDLSICPFSFFFFFLINLDHDLSILFIFSKRPLFVILILAIFFSFIFFNLCSDFYILPPSVHFGELCLLFPSFSKCVMFK